MMDMVATGALQCTCGGMFTRHKKLERLTVLRH
jgi:hypothetical protein